MDSFNDSPLEIEASEHISPTKTGDNIEAKRVALYSWKNSEWKRVGFNDTPGIDFDYLGVASTGATEDTLTYKTGGAGGTTVKTIVVTYASASVEKLSSQFTSLGWS